MKCKEIRLLLNEYLEGMLDLETKSLIEKHLEECGECSRELVFIKAYKGTLSSLPEVQAPEDFLQKVHEKIDKKISFKKIIDLLLFPLRLKVPLRLATVAVGIIILVVVLDVVEKEKQDMQSFYMPSPKEEVKETIPYTPSPVKEKIGIKKKEVFKPKTELFQEKYTDMIMEDKVDEEINQEEVFQKEDKKDIPRIKEESFETAIVRGKDKDKNIALEYYHVSGQTEGAAVKKPKARDAVTPIERRGSSKYPRQLKAKKMSSIIESDIEEGYEQFQNKMVSDIREQVGIFGGKVINVSYKEETKIVESMIADIPWHNTNTFMNKLAEYDSSKIRFSTDESPDNKMMRVCIQLINAE